MAQRAMERAKIGTVRFLCSLVKGTQRALLHERSARKEGGALFFLKNYAVLIVVWDKRVFGAERLHA